MCVCGGGDGTCVYVQGGVGWVYGGKGSGKYMSEGSEAVTDLVRAVDDDELPISPLLHCSGRQGAV